MTEQQQLTGFKTACAAACRRGVLWGVLAASVVLTGCGSRVSLNRAPVEDRGTPTAATASGTLPSTSTATTATLKPLPGIENAGKPGYYTIRPGDTIIRIGLETGQNWRDIARWNGLDNANIIEVGQVLRVVPPVAGGLAGVAPNPSYNASANPATTTGEVTPGAFIPRPVASPTPVVATSIPPAGSRTTSASAAASSAAATPNPAPTAAASAPAASAGDDDVAWIWPSTGTVIAGFDDVKNKGLDIAGKLGDPVLAAGDGRVVYAGAGLRGYGNLVILKHNNTYLTAYAHNQTLLVKEDQTVRKGQKIAEIGQSDADRVKLHFEIRRQGKPVDPSRYLPAR
jgi:lipoprotein NlpD